MCKKLICLASVVLVLSFVLTTGARADLVGWWKLDDGSGTTAIDSSGNGNDGKLNGDHKWVAGKVGGALEMDGGDYVEVPGVSEINPESITMMTWINFSTVDGADMERQDYLSRGDDYAFSLHEWGFRDGTEAEGKITAIVTSAGGWTVLSGTTLVEPDTWYHTTLTYDSGTQMLMNYLDGELEGEMELTTGLEHRLGGSLTIGTYNGRDLLGKIDDIKIFDEALSEEQIKAEMRGEGYPFAFGPTPADGAFHEDTWVNLSWRAGEFAVSHDIYFGENFNDVNRGTGGTFMGNQTSTWLQVGTPGFPYPDGLVPGTTYYWRIDEINVIHPDSPWRGDVWSFSILPEISITDPSPVGWWKFDEGSGNIAIDSSDNGFDITLHNTTWEDGVFGGALYFQPAGYGAVGNFRYSDNAITVCAWVRHDAFRIGKIERYVTVVPEVAVIRKEANGSLHFYIKTDGSLRHLWVSGVLTEGRWHHVAGTWDGVTQRLYIDSVEIASQVPGGVLGNTSNVELSSRGESFNGMLDEVRIYNRALTEPEILGAMEGLVEGWPYAYGPDPADSAKFIEPNVRLSWKAGFNARSHRVYFGDDFDDVDAGTGGTYKGSMGITTFTPGPLEFEKTYYWRVDEFDGTESHKGEVWSFTTVDNILSEALDTTLGFTTGGDADWFSQTTKSYHDGDAAQSGEITDEQESWMQTTVNGAGTVSFFWKVSSEGNYDCLEFYIDGTLEGQISESEDWHEMTYEIPVSSSHILEWRYFKDSSMSRGDDCGWVDKVEWVIN